jgi:hypothetical protein
MNFSFNYKSFNLVDLHEQGEFTCIELVNSDGYKLQGCTRDANWVDYAMRIVDDYYDYLSENNIII